MITDLQGQQTEISEKLRVAIIVRILERRTDISQVLQFLHDGEQKNNDLCRKLTKPAIARIITRLIKRLYPNPEAISEEETGGSSAESASEDSTCMELDEPSLKEKLNRAIQNKLNRPNMTTKLPAWNKLSCKKCLSSRTTRFGDQTLKKVYYLLKTIPLTSFDLSKSQDVDNLLNLLENGTISDLEEESDDEIVQAIPQKMFV
ncbi:unnamed protein product [Parnassius apollo]|uniref:(apollo) hypothetical protein n=1 Tax=Parnassius apollo TaxID=110799 RepID=A0A8S3YAW8_PARAO|nr:unnamed protein product [Parnassius apollo]